MRQDFAVFDAPAAWQAIDIISDLHLSQAMPRTFEAWSVHLRHTDADAVFILGDLFEVWIGDDTRTRAFEQRCVERLGAAGRQRRIAFMAGNRDFLVGPAMLADASVDRLRDPTVLRAFGRRWLLTHGDALCVDDHDYQAFRREVRSPAWQQAFLARPVDERASVAQAIRSESQSRKDRAPAATVWADVDAAAALAWLAISDCRTMIHGHTHRPGRTTLDEHHERQVLSDWDFEVTPWRGDVLRLDATGLHRCLPVGTR